MYYIARLSGGLASAIAADRLIQCYGRKKVWLRFEDTLFESDDTYRFINDCMKRWGGRLWRGCDGRTPLQVFEDKQIIPDNAHAPCTYELKLKPFLAWLWRVPKPVTICLGLDWHEPQRIEKILHYHRHQGKPRRPQGFGRYVPGVYEAFPLLWRPIEFRPYADVVRSWGIEPPEAYAQGFGHNNCGGRCVKQGIREWRRLRALRPESFNAMAQWELAQQARGGARVNRTILKDRRGGEV